MNKKTIGIFKGLACFAVGAGAGATVMYLYLKDKFDAKYEEAAESFRVLSNEKKSGGEELKKQSEQKQEIKEETKTEKKIFKPEPIGTKPDRENFVDYAKQVKTEGYISKEENKKDKPYVISPEEFDDNTEYNVYSLTYFADGVLADDFMEPVDDVENTVGLDFPNHFGEYEEDEVYVRNDVIGADYSICLDSRNYSDVVEG